MAIEFLKGTTIELTGWHIAGDRKKGYGIEKSVTKGDWKISGARAAGGEGRCRLTGNPIKNISHETGNALMMYGDSFYVVCAFIHSVDNANVPMPANAEDIGHVLTDQIVDNYLTAVQKISARH
jgi:hypothetical protein